MRSSESDFAPVRAGDFSLSGDEVQPLVDQFIGAATCPVDAGSHAVSPFDLGEALPVEGQDVMRAPEVPAKARLENGVDQGLPWCARVTQQGKGPVGKRGLHSVGSPMGAGAESEVFPVYASFEKVFQCQLISKIPLHKACSLMMALPQSSLQWAIGLAQLLLSHPRDGKFIQTFLKQTDSKSSDTPVRRDLLPFQF